MSDTSAIDPKVFMQAVQPLLERKDLAGLMALLKSRWSCDQLRALLHSDYTDAKKVALLAVGLVGEKTCVHEIAMELRHRDPMVNEMAEHALWQVWFRCGTPGANHQLARGAQALERRDFPHAVKHFDEAIAQCPDFAEAYNQRAIAHYLMESYELSIADCQRSIELMPCHFGALAGMGHCQAHLNKCEDAVNSYRRALEVNPHLDCIRQTIEELDSHD